MKNTNNNSEISVSPPQSRREFMRKAMYASPVLLTLPASPSFAQQGSGGAAGGGDPGGGTECEPQIPQTGPTIQMCRFNATLNGGQDIFVTEAEVEAELARGSGFGSCASFFCNAS